MRSKRPIDYDSLQALPRPYGQEGREREDEWRPAGWEGGRGGKRGANVLSGYYSADYTGLLAGHVRR